MANQLSRALGRYLAFLTRSPQYLERTPPRDRAGSELVVIGSLFCSERWINFEDTSLSNASGITRYGQSKLANILHTKTLNKLFGPDSSSARAGDGEIWSVAVHPGLVESQLAVRAALPSWFKLVLAPYVALGGKMDADRGSWTSVYCAASPKMKKEHSGAYFQRIADSAGWQSGLAKDESVAEKLEEWTRKEMAAGGWVNQQMFSATRPT